MQYVLGVIGGSGVYALEDLEGVEEIDVDTPYGPPSDLVIRGRDKHSGVTMLFLPRHGRGHRVSPSDINYRANICALKMLGECAEARRSMTGTTDADVLIGDILIAQGKLEEARAQYQRVLSFPILTPEQKTNVEFKIAEVAYFEGKFDDAVKALQPLTQVNSFDVANDALGLSMFIADSRKPTDAPLREYAKAALLHRQRKYSEASAIVQNLIVSFPSSILVDRSYIFRAELERKSGQEQQAILTLESFLAKYTDSILRDRAQFDLAELYQSVLHNKEKAVDLYQSLLRDFPNSLLSNEARRRILFLRNTNL